MSRLERQLPSSSSFFETMRMPRLYLGTMTFSWSQTSSRVDEAVAKDMVAKFVSYSKSHVDNIDADEAGAAKTVIHVDTARVYAGGNTEPCVAHALAAAFATPADSSISTTANGVVFAVGTKAHPSQPGGLSPTGIKEQFDASRAAMPGAHPFAEYYLHQPDPDHSLLESLRCLHEYYTQGLIEAVGMSNYHASEMERAFLLCEQHNLTPPTVYQGLYNPLNRLVEDELLAVLHKHNCSFVAYNPLAAGLLAGKYETQTAPVVEIDNDMKTVVPKGRFRNNPNYLPRFYTASNFAAVELIRKACSVAKITMIEATYRWLLCHSALGSNDGILIGASSMKQLEQNLIACTEPLTPLSEPVLAAFEEAWKVTSQAGVFPYWRSYSYDMPNRDALDPGASYEASKAK